ncbi:MAG: sulfur carrier protein ThiS [Muribaculaceae bacterium]|nr:sulfur carrier protein ThiS [Muribaculaceae bacterium]
MKINVNDQPREIGEGSTIADLLKDIPEEGTATALNGRFISQDVRQTAILREGDEVIIISAAYGG